MQIASYLIDGNTLPDDIVRQIGNWFCRGHDGLRNFLRPRTRQHQHVPADRRKLQFLRRTVTIWNILQAV